MKRITSLLLAVCLVFSVFLLPAAAAEPPRVLVDITTGAVDIQVSGAPSDPATVKISRESQIMYLDSAYLDQHGKHTFHTQLPLDYEYKLYTNVAGDASTEIIITKAAPPVDVKAVQKAAETFLLRAVSNPQFGKINGDWTVMALARANADVPQDYYETYYTNVSKHVSEVIDDSGRLAPNSPEDNSRLVMALTALGKDVTYVDGHNLLHALSDMKYLVKEGLEGPVQALLALDSHDYPIPDDQKATVQATREDLVKCILDAQNEDGGWSFQSEASDAQSTAKAIQALAPYCNMNAAASDAVEKGFDMLKALQTNRGAFSEIQADGTQTDTCEATAQVIIALTAMNRDPHTDSLFLKNGYSPVNALCGFAADNGGFRHIRSENVSTVATEQGYAALVAYNRFLEKQSPLYDMNDVILQKDPNAPVDPVEPTTPSSDPTDSTKPVDPNHTHEYVWTVTKQSTKTTPGELTGTCSCGETQKREIPIAGKSGDITVVANKSNACAATFGDSNTVSRIPLTKKEQDSLIAGKDLVITMNVSNVDDVLPQPSKDLIQKAAEDWKVGLYLDISLFKQLEGEEQTPIHQTQGAVKISLLIPENLRKAGRTYGMIRLHEGTPEKLDCSFDGKTNRLSFDSDQFSAYALVYTDKAPTPPTAPSGSTTPTGATTPGGSNGGGTITGGGSGPATGDSSGIGNIFALIAAGIVLILLFTYGRKKKI